LRRTGSCVAVLSTRRVEPVGREGPGLGALVSGALGARQGGALDARGELHRFLFVAGVREGRVITWESQATDYPSIGADTSEYEPRGCPRGASFS
jgi:hypothetical protein